MYIGCAVRTGGWQTAGRPRPARPQGDRDRLGSQVEVVRTTNCNSLLASFSVALDKLKLQTVTMKHP